MLTKHKFDSRQAASAAAAARMAGLIGAQIARDGDAWFVVSGGTTPDLCFEFLSGYELDWARVNVAMSDERWVPADHEDSNERLIRKALLKNAAEDAHLLSVFTADETVETHTTALRASRPSNGFACSMVGMGADGHFASLFPDAENLDEGLRLDNDNFYIPVSTSASPHPRVSMTLSALLDCREVLVLIFGEEKLAVFDNAHTVDKTYPVTALLMQDQTPVSLYWAP